MITSLRSFFAGTAHRPYPLLAGVSLFLVVAGFSPESFGHDSVLKARPAERRALNVPIADFALTDQNGARVGFETLRGNPVVINFLYTSCPDVCPLLTTGLKIMRGRMSPQEARDVRFLSITTDPEIDTPEVLKAYSERHGVDSFNWSWLTGNPRVLAAVWKNFGVSVERQARGLIDHTTLTVIADARGNMRFAYFGSAPDPDVLLEDLRALGRKNPI